MYDSLCAARGSEGIIVYTLTGATLNRDREHGTVRSGHSLSSIYSHVTLHSMGQLKHNNNCRAP